MTGWIVFLCLCILYDCTHVLGSTCTSGTFQAVPGTGCQSYHRCVNGEWYFLKEDCSIHQLWDNALHTCMPEHQVDTATCTTKHGTGTSSGSGAHSHLDCGNTNCHHGLCDPNHSDKSICNTGYMGDHCDLQIVSNANCYNQCQHGKCVFNMHTNRYHCECDSGYHGTRCTAIDGSSSSGGSHSNSTCGNTRCYHGHCDPYHPDKCTCNTGYRGDQCSYQVVSNAYCYNHCQYGNCVLNMNINTYHCECDSGYHGSNCTAVHVTASKTATTSTTSTTSTPVQCLDLDLRAVPNTGCRYFEICVNSKWHQPPNKCNDGYLWDDNMKSCQPASNVDQNTCKTLHSAV